MDLGNEMHRVGVKFVKYFQKFLETFNIYFGSISLNIHFER